MLRPDPGPRFTTSRSFSDTSKSWRNILLQDLDLLLQLPGCVCPRPRYIAPYILELQDMDALLQTLDHLLLQDLDVVNGGAGRRRHFCLMLLVLNDRRRRQYSVLAAGSVLPPGVSVSPYTAAQCQYSVLVQVRQSSRLHLLQFIRQTTITYNASTQRFCTTLCQLTYRTSGHPTF